LSSRKRSRPVPGTRLSDVAREVGVSTATVSRVINNLSYVSPEMRERVMRVVRRRNYYPNAHARSLASGRSDIIGLVISDIANPFFPELVKGMESAAFEHGYEVILANTNYDAARMSNYVRRFIERGVRGVALMTSEFDAELVKELARRSVAVVFLDSGAPGRHVSNLSVDYETGIDQAVRHLAKLGHRRIAYVGGPARMSSSRRRLQAFRRSVRASLDGEPAGLYAGDFRIEGGRRAARQMLAGDSRPSAVVVANDMMALGVMQECRAAGLHIPSDLSVIGFDDIAFAGLTQPPLTTVSLPRQILGQKAIAALLATIDHPEHQGVEIAIPTALVVRESTAAVPAHTGRAAVPAGA
jgi:DNA-binding LacI/PurR family transcriptional regulator